MAPKIRISLAVLILLGFSGLGLAQNPPPAVEQNVTLLLPAGAKPLPPGQHRATIDVSGKPMAARIQVGTAAAAEPARQSGAAAPAAAESPNPAAPSAPAAVPAPPPPATPWLIVGLAALVPVLLIVIAALVYFKRIVPRRNLEPYRKAVEMLQAARYGDALPLLTEVEGKLSGATRREARFFIAFASGMTDDNEEAERVATALHREDSSDPHAAYLLAWILLRKEKYDRAEPVLERMESDGKLGFRDAKRLLGIVKFARANEAFRNGRVDAAAELFEKVLQLGDFAEHVPADLRNRHIVLGTQALFEKDAETARKQFQQLEAATGAMSGAPAALLRAKAKLGLALVAWAEEDSDQTETLLAATAKLFDPEGPDSLPWPDQIAEIPVSAKVKALEEKKAEQSGGADAANRCLRDIHFLRGMNGLRAWARMGSKDARAGIAEQYKLALGRFACAQARDDSFADVYLVAGLLMYYLRKAGKERAQGIELLELARRNKMHEPESLQILAARDKLAKVNADTVARYMEVLDRYIGDETVTEAVRANLLEHLAAFARYASLERRPDLRHARPSPPTVEELRSRSQILRKRVGDLSTGGSADAEHLRGLSVSLEQESELLLKQARTIEQKESALLAAAGDALFRDDRI